MIQIKCFEFNFLPVNTYVIWDETKEAAIIDPGCFFDGEAERLSAFIKENNLTVKLLLNTHLHFDHVFGNNYVEEHYCVKAKASDLDSEWIRDVNGHIGMPGIRFRGAVNPILPGNVLKEGDTVSMGNTTFQVLHIPGHSPGSLVFYCNKENVLFSGDVLFQDGCGRTDFPDSNPEVFYAGIRTKLLTLPPQTIIYPGHGPATTIQHEKANY